MGADEHAGEVADALGMEVHKMPSTSETRAFTKIGIFVAEPKAPLARNPDIIDYGDCVVVCPARMKEELRSGTWAAVRYARRNDCLIWIVWPDGSLTTPLQPSP